MRKNISRLVAALVMVAATFLMSVPQEAEAQSQWNYASVSYFETDLLNGYNPCLWIATECTSEAGSSCTESGSKSRGLLYCMLPHFENFK